MLPLWLHTNLEKLVCLFMLERKSDMRQQTILRKQIREGYSLSIASADPFLKAFFSDKKTRELL